MPTRLAQKIVINTGAGSQTVNYNFDELDLSRADGLRFVLEVTGIATDVADTFDVYVQSRNLDGSWNDRVAFAQLTGDMANAEIRDAHLQQFGSLSDTEEMSEPSGSAGGSRLTAGTVKNGIFPGIYRDSTGPGPAWRCQVVVVDADSDGDLEANLWVYANSADAWPT